MLCSGSVTFGHREIDKIVGCLGLLEKKFASLSRARYCADRD